MGEGIMGSASAGRRNGAQIAQSEEELTETVRAKVEAQLNEGGASVE